MPTYESDVLYFESLGMSDFRLDPSAAAEKMVNFTRIFFFKSTSSLKSFSSFHLLLDSPSMWIAADTKRWRRHWRLYITAPYRGLTCSDVDGCRYDGAVTLADLHHTSVSWTNLL